MKKAKKSSARITLRTVLDHVQALHGEMLMRFRAMDKRFAAIDQNFISVDQRFVVLERRINERIDLLERNLTRQIDGIDERLDDIEVKVIPTLRKAITAR